MLNTIYHWLKPEPQNKIKMIKVKDLKRIELKINDSHVIIQTEVDSGVFKIDVDNISAYLNEVQMITLRDSFDIILRNQK